MEIETDQVNILETKDLLINQYGYSPDQVVINAKIEMLTEEFLEVDIGLKGSKDEYTIIVLVVETQIAKKEILSRILINTNLTYGYIRYMKNNGSTELYGLKKTKNFFSRKPKIVEVLDFPAPTTFFDRVVDLFTL